MHQRAFPSRACESSLQDQAAARPRRGAVSVAMRDPLPFIVLPGFHGAGKTTLLNRVLKQPEPADTAVPINEFGEVGFDHLSVEALHDDVVRSQPTLGNPE